ncbi:MAG: SprT family zinc-dependent metalloprotease [Nitrospirota bacterium]
MHRIVVSSIAVDVVRKNIKNLHLAVYPPNGRVRVAVPFRMNDDAVRLAIISKLAWIKRHQTKFAGQERQSAREFVTGESHYFQGRRYRLNVVDHSGAPKVIINSNTAIDLLVREGSDKLKRQRVLTEWYRRKLKEQIPELIDKWQPVLNVSVDDWGVKQMKTKWGTCNIKVHRIWLNLELVKKPVHCLEYIIVHEMLHLLERNHNDRFKLLMDKFMPQWRSYREELNRAPLAHDAWGY